MATQLLLLNMLNREVLVGRALLQTCLLLDVLHKQGCAIHSDIILVLGILLDGRAHCIRVALLQARVNGVWPVLLKLSRLMKLARGTLLIVEGSVQTTCAESRSIICYHYFAVELGQIVVQMVLEAT